MRTFVPLTLLSATATALVAVPRPPISEIHELESYDFYTKRDEYNATAARGLGTSADIYIFNDWSEPITFTTSDHSRMSKSPPASVPVSSFGASSGYSIEANGWIPLQSSFKFAFQTPSDEKSGGKVDIGVSPWRTGYSLSGGSEYETAVLLAPAKILEKGRDFDFYFYTGPGEMGPLISSLLESNLGAFFAGVKKNPQKIALNPDIDITIKEFINPIVTCKYASVKPGLTDWGVTAIVDFTSEIKMRIRYKKLTQDATLKVTDFSVLAGAALNLGGLKTTNYKMANLKFSVSKLQTSIGDIKIDGDILVDIVGALYPVLAPVLKLPYKLASIINISENKNILKMINAAAGGFTGSTTKRWSLPTVDVSGLFKRFVSAFSSGDSKKVTRAVKNISTWMSAPEIQAKDLASLYIPGTHDSHAYSFDNVLSSMRYSDISFLWDMDYFLPAPSDGSFNPMKETPIHLGPVLGKYAMSSIARVAKAQGSDILSQLKGGVRHFDLRVYYDSAADKFYTQHGLRAKATLIDILNQVQQFIKANPSAAELIILDVSHTNFNQDFTLIDGTIITSQQVQFKYLGTIRQLEQWTYVPINARGTKNFNFQTLKSTVLSQITQGSNKVLFINPDITLPELSVNTEGWMNVPSGVTPKGGLYEISIAATLTPGEILENIMNGLCGVGEKELLKVKATQSNAAIVEKVRGIEGEKKTKVQLVSVDWWDIGKGGKTAVEAIVGMNYP
ncbi:hypothetical protein TWF481_003078 [Arthrobotrys musiformis]|uniref:Phosphatidylinositol-specific phospholipase C X domain-containing protein n=1 Tax=Arthrobotrys musiformis TaxID=47236 RepID=A0AAV9VRS3_9PEZI